MLAIKETQFNFPGQTAFQKGKVRDIYTINDKYVVIIATDRISAFDVVLPEPIPYKGQVLNLIAAYFLKSSKSIVPNWLLDVPHPAVSIGYKCKPFAIEMVIRGYLCGHAWREYQEGKRSICGVPMPEGMKQNQAFPHPIITPSTKAENGHDVDISKEEIIEQGIISYEDYSLLEKYTYKLFEFGSKVANEKGLILVDTKYEFGKLNDKIYLIDEVHTPDSSRYFYLEGYEKRLKNNEAQKQLSKEFVREWLMSQGFSGGNGQTMPEFTDSIISRISGRYIELYEKITGNTFEMDDSAYDLDRMYENIIECLRKIEE